MDIEILHEGWITKSPPLERTGYSLFKAVSFIFYFSLIEMVILDFNLFCFLYIFTIYLNVNITYDKFYMIFLYYLVFKSDLYEWLKSY